MDYRAEVAYHEGRGQDVELKQAGEVIAKHAPQGLDPDGRCEPECGEELQQAGGAAAKHAPRDHRVDGDVHLAHRARGLHYDDRADRRKYDSSGYYEDAIWDAIYNSRQYDSSGYNEDAIGDAIYSSRRYDSGVLGAESGPQGSGVVWHVDGRLTDTDAAEQGPPSPEEKGGTHNPGHGRSAPMVSASSSTGGGMASPPVAHRAGASAGASHAPSGRGQD